MRVLIFSFLVVIIDQISKLYVKGVKISFLGIDIKGMPYGSSKNIFGSFFKLTFIENPGMAFGLEIGGKLLLSVFTILATLLIVYFIYKNRNESFYLRLSLAFILGGAAGNLMDRIFYGYFFGYAPLFYGKVVDFFHIDIPDFMLFGKHFYTWPIFNVADISVTAGFLLILFGYKKIFHNKENKDIFGEGIITSESSNDMIVDNTVHSENAIDGYRNTESTDLPISTDIPINGNLPSAGGLKKEDLNNGTEPREG